MTTTLNKQKPYATIWGGNLGASFSQDGRYFDHEGIEVPIESLNVDAAAADQPAQQPRPVAVLEEVSNADALAATLAQRQTELLLQAVPLLEKGQDSLIPELADYDTELLTAMLSVEGVAKKRSKVLEALQLELTAKAEQAAQDERAANGGTPPADQVAAQLQQ